MSRKEEREQVARSYTNNIDNICGSVGEQTRNAFIAGAEWADKTMLDKACEWLMLNADDYIWDGVEEHSSAMRHDFINDFCKAMEE